MPVKRATFNNQQILGGLSATFTRPRATVDPLGVAVESGSPRYDAPIGYCEPAKWTVTAADVGGTDSLPLAAGVDFDGVTPYAAFRSTATGEITTWKRIDGTWTLQQTIDYSTNTDLMGGTVADKRYRPEVGIIHYGLLMIFCERHEDPGAGYTPVGVSMVYSNDYGANLSVAFDQTNSEAATGDEGIGRLREFINSNTFPVAGESHDVSAWVPWSDYLEPGGATRPAGGVVGLLKITRTDNSATAWTVGTNRTVYELWDDTAYTAITKHSHGVDITAGGLRSSWGDTKLQNEIKFHALDLSDHLNATVTTTDGWHGGDGEGDTSLDSQPSSSQPVGAAPGPDSGSSIWSGDNSPGHVIQFASSNAATDDPEITQLAGFRDRDTTGTLLSGRDPLFIQYCPGYGYTSGGGSSNTYHISQNGRTWGTVADISTNNRLLMLAGSYLVAIDSTAGCIAEAPMPVVRTLRTLLTSPGLDNLAGATWQNINQSPATGVTVKLVTWNSSAGRWEYDSDSTALDPQPPDPPFLKTAAVYEIESNGDATVYGKWYYDAGGSTTDLAATHATEHWVFGLDKETDPDHAYRVGNPSNETNAERGFETPQNTAWSLCPRVDTQGAATGTGRIIHQGWASRISTRSNPSRFLLATPGVYMDDRFSYPVGPLETSNADETLEVTGFACGSAWTASGMMVWPQHRVLATAAYTVATLYGDANNHIQIQVEHTSLTAGRVNAVVTSGGSVVGTINLANQDAFATMPIAWAISSDGTSIYASAYSPLTGYTHGTVASQQLATQPVRYHAGNADQSRIIPIGHASVVIDEDNASTTTASREAAIESAVKTANASLPIQDNTMKIRGTFSSGSTGSTLNISFTTDAPAVASAAYMTIIPTTGPLIGRPYRVASLTDNGGGNYTATIFGELPSGVAPASGNTFEMGFVSEQIETNAPR